MNQVPKKQYYNNFNFKSTSDSNENGSILLELCISIPLILFICFTGFELSRSALIRLVLSDIVREATLSSYICSFRDESARINCFQEVINELQIIASNTFPANPDQGLPGFLISLEAYEVDETQLPSRDQLCFNTNNIQGMSQLHLRNLVSIVPQEILPFKNYTLSGRSEEEHLLGNLFPPNSSQSAEFIRKACLNGSIFIAEVHLSYEPIIQIDFSMFFYGSEGNPGVFNSRKEFHAVVVL
jgi:hypothetical protein